MYGCVYGCVYACCVMYEVNLCVRLSLFSDGPLNNRFVFAPFDVILRSPSPFTTVVFPFHLVE